MAKTKYQKKVKGSVIAKAALAVLVAGVLTAGVCCLGYASRNDNGDWFGGLHWSDKVQTEKEPEGEDNPIAGGLVISDGESKGMVLSRSSIAPASFKDYGIDTQAESAFTLTATITPASADDKRVGWTIAPLTGDADASDYITLTTNGLTATVACKQAFDVQFIITVKSLDNPEAIATCTLDYVEKVTGVTVNMPQLTSPTAAITYTIESSKYTIKSDINVTFSNFVFDLENFGRSFIDELCLSNVDVLWFHPTYTNQLVQYTSTGLEFLHGGSIIMADGYYDVCVDGLVGCIVALSGQTCDYEDIDEGDIIAAFRTVAGTDALGTVDVTVSSSYGGTTYSSVNETVEIWVDGSSFHISVSGISLNESSLIF